MMEKKDADLTRNGRESAYCPRRADACNRVSISCNKKQLPCDSYSDETRDDAIIRGFSACASSTCRECIGLPRPRRQESSACSHHTRAPR